MDLQDRQTSDVVYLDCPSGLRHCAFLRFRGYTNAPCLALVFINQLPRLLGSLCFFSSSLRLQATLPHLLDDISQIFRTHHRPRSGLVLVHTSNAGARLQVGSPSQVSGVQHPVTFQKQEATIPSLLVMFARESQHELGFLPRGPVLS